MEGSLDPGRRQRPTFAELFTPKLVTILREGYTLNDFRADAIAGLTVAIVALPLSMAIAIAAGVAPERGLYTAIIGGFLVSALGGSRFQIGGPAGAFIVLVASIVERQGYDGLVLATLVAGLILIVVGFLRLGTYIKYIPFPVTVGFTAGIAVIIFASQLKELLGLTLATEPAAFIPKVAAIGGALGTVNISAVAVGGGDPPDDFRNPPLAPGLARSPDRGHGRGGNHGHPCHGCRDHLFALWRVAPEPAGTGASNLQCREARCDPARCGDDCASRGDRVAPVGRCCGRHVRPASPLQL